MATNVLKGVLLAGGTGSRLDPLTRITNKHLLPVYNKPMIFYALETLRRVGVADVLLVSIAQALGLAEDFSRGGNIVVILGDNIFMRPDELCRGIAGFADVERGGRLFLKHVPDASRFGVAEIAGGTVVSIEEKPENPKTDLAVTGFYAYDARVFDIIKTLKPSGRGELEITDVNNWYIREGVMTHYIIEGEWTDAGTFDSLFRASRLIAEQQRP
ncbi:MAG: glucose-1-phosphate thymidylyltransferase [Parcubacteria group bacterium Gr01-1014_29]|nr:MAG: glucose-1-phosphate thymidylyltransferase [Parcubacteria group bacterium Gr01-1014_29]